MASLIVQHPQTPAVSLPQSPQQNKSLQISSPGTEAGPWQATGAGHCSTCDMCVATQKSQTLWYTDTIKDLPSCTLIHAAGSEVVEELAANGKEEA